MGESGSGKSTYLRALSGVFGPAHQGWLEFESKSVGRYATVPYSPAIYISQHSVLHSGSVKQNLVSGLGREVDDKVLRRTLRDVGMTPTDDFLGYEIDAQNSNISGGERQRLLLARTILHSVPVIIIDEVTSGLDLDTERKIWTLLKDMSKSKIIFIATHSTLALSYCDRIIRLPFESDLPYDKQMGTKNIV